MCVCASRIALANTAQAGCLPHGSCVSAGSLYQNQKKGHSNVARSKYGISNIHCIVAKNIKEQN